MINNDQLDISTLSRETSHGSKTEEDHDMEEKSRRRKSLRDVKWVASFLGVTKNTVHQWIADGHIPYINLGMTGGRRIIRFDPEVIEAWLYDRTYTPGKSDKEN